MASVEYSRDSEALSWLKDFIEEWRSRSIGKPNIRGLARPNKRDALYQRYERLFRELWKAFAKDIKPMIKPKLDDVLRFSPGKLWNAVGDDVALYQALVMESAQDSLRYVVPLFSTYEHFLEELWIEVYERKSPFSNFLFNGLPEGCESEIRERAKKYMSNRESKSVPGRAILSPLLEKGPKENENQFLQKALGREPLTMKYSGGEMQLNGVEVDTVTWTDWHSFMYGFRNIEAHGNPTETLAKGCLKEERRTKLKQFLQRQFETDPDDHRLIMPETVTGEKYFARDMIRLLTEMEQRLAERGEGQYPVDPFTGNDWEWRKIRKEHVSRDLPGVTTYDEFCSYTVKLWMPRVLRSLAVHLVATLTHLANEKRKEVAAAAPPPPPPPLAKEAPAPAKDAAAVANADVRAELWDDLDTAIGHLKRLGPNLGIEQLRKVAKMASKAVTQCEKKSQQ